MVQKPRRNAVQDIIDNLLNSEIPEIQNVAKELTDWTKQLEEHSWKLQHYASEIQSLAAAEPDASTEVNLVELVRDLERTLAELKQRPSDAVAEPEFVGEVEEEAEIEEGAEEAVEEVESFEGDMEPGEDAGRQKIKMIKYTTPEGFVVRRRRY